MARFIIIGLTSQGLSLLRMLSRDGHEVIAFSNTKKAIGCFSKFGQKRLFSSIADLKSQINKILSEGSVKKCIITSGELLALIIEEFPDLYKICDVESSPIETVRMLSYKHQMYDFAKRRGLYCAKYQLLSDYNSGDLEFPVILKRNYEIPLFFKVKKVYSDEMLMNFIKKIPDELHSRILVQEFIPTENVDFVTFQAYVIEGQIKCVFIGKQTRRLSKGLTCFIEEIVDLNLREKILLESEKLLSNISYKGFIEIEYLYKIDENKVVFMETNTRPCGTQSVLAYKFPDLARIYSNSCFEIDTGCVNPIQWVNILRDIKARILYGDFNGLSQLFRAKKDVLDWTDFKPFVMQFWK